MSCSQISAGAKRSGHTEPWATQIEQIAKAFLGMASQDNISIINHKVEPQISMCKSSEWKMKTRNCPGFIVKITITRMQRIPMDTKTPSVGPPNLKYRREIKRLHSGFQ